ncbi:MAG: hypothetical protein GX660_26935 [Clostridiaceae bacterium]|nr:hypothetical protein [Clostridiaceae bacterium]
MKKTQEILGLPIISISDGLEVGRVKNIIINAREGSADYVVVDSGIQILGAKIIPTEKVLGIGEYALTIENEEAINDLSKIPAAIDLLQQNIQVKGTKVLTQKGRLMGEIGDIFVDEDENCMIVGLEYIADITQKKIRIIPRESVLTFGKNLVIVKENVENTLLDRASDLKAKTIHKHDEMPVANNIETSETVYKTDKAPSDESESFVKDTAASLLSEQSEALEVVKHSDMGGQDSKSVISGDKGDQIEHIPENNENISDNTVNQNPIKEKVSGKAMNSTSNPVNLFEQRQKQYLKGRLTTKTITGASGNILINEGSRITEELIDLAKENGKLIELVMNNKA